MKELLLRGAQYNAWANGLFTGIIGRLPEAVLDREIPSSFPSIRKTLVHVWSSEDTWLQRLQGVASPVWLGGTFRGTIAEACDSWNTCSAAIVAYVDAGQDGDFTQRISYANLKGEPQYDRIDAILQHMINHATYHRGQLVTMLRQCSIMTIPATDLIAFERMTELPDRNN